jgi:P pilus assembly chaperone PapD
MPVLCLILRLKDNLYGSGRSGSVQVENPVILNSSGQVQTIKILKQPNRVFPGDVQQLFELNNCQCILVGLVFQ